MKIGDNMKKDKNGFTLIELLAVIVILGIIMVIATTSVLKNINDSKEKSKYTAAKEIVEISEAYFAINSDVTFVTINDLKDYLESDATNPKTGDNDLLTEGKDQMVCKGSYSAEDQDKYSNNNGKGYYFDGYFYSLDGSCPESVD
jgi:prepilin-type N-terminal cleavage/methylation domain-containing protein